MEKTMFASGVLGTITGAAYAYDKKESTTVNILKGTVYGLSGGAIGFVTPPVTGLIGIKAVEYIKPIAVTGTSIGLGLSGMKLFSKFSSAESNKNSAHSNENKTTLRNDTDELRVLRRN